MFLFSSFKHPIILILFLYLGLLSGTIFYSFCFLTKPIKFKKNLINKIFNIVFSFLKCVIIIFSFFITFKTNLNLNWGVLNFWFLIVWVLSFCLSYVFVKTLANSFCSFYNKHIKGKFKIEKRKRKHAVKN